MIDRAPFHFSRSLWLGLLLRILIRHPLESDNPLSNGGVRRKHVAQEPLDVGQGTGGRVHDTEMGRASRDRARGRGSGGQFLQRGGQRPGVTGELGAGGIGEILPLAAHRHGEESGDDRRDHQRQQPQHEDDQAQRVPPAPAPPPPPPAPPPPPPPPPPATPPPPPPQHAAAPPHPRA